MKTKFGDLFLGLLSEKYRKFSKETPLAKTKWAGCQENTLMEDSQDEAEREVDDS